MGVDWSELGNAALTLGLALVVRQVHRRPDTPRSSKRLFALLLPILLVSFSFHLVAGFAPLPGR